MVMVYSSMAAAPLILGAWILLLAASASLALSTVNNIRSPYIYNSEVSNPVFDHGASNVNRRVLRTRLDEVAEDDESEGRDNDEDEEFESKVDASDRNDDDSDAESAQKVPMVVEGNLSKEMQQEVREQRIQGQNQQQEDDDVRESKVADDLEVQAKKQEEQLKQKDAKLAREEAGRKQLKMVVIREDKEGLKSGESHDEVVEIHDELVTVDEPSSHVSTPSVILERTDAYKNTKEHFERLDVEKGKEVGHHFEKYKAARQAFTETRTNTQSVVDDPRQANGNPNKVVPHFGGESVGNGKEFYSDGRKPEIIDLGDVQSVKFREYVARRKKMLEEKQKKTQPRFAWLGKNEKGVVTLHGNITTPNKKVQKITNPNKRIHAVPDLRPEAQKQSSVKKILNKIPIVKRAYKRSKAEETLIDAALSFTRGLSAGVFRTNEALTYKKKAALLDWFELLSVSLPPEIGLHELIDTLKQGMDEISQKHENLKLVVGKHQMPEQNWQSCAKSTKPFFCGFWKLLHIMSVGFAEQAGGLALRDASPSIRVFSAKQAADVVREYMTHFFPCTHCVQRFVAKYDDCSYQRCHRLSDATDDATAESWQEFPLWLWEVHNDVSKSISSDEINADATKIGRKAEDKQWEQKMQIQYPHIEQCNACYTADATWNLVAVYNHLENEYWTLGHEVEENVDNFLEYNGGTQNYFTWLHYLMIFVIVLLAVASTKKFRVRATGRHKKDDTATVDRFPRKYRNS